MIREIRFTSYWQDDHALSHQHFGSHAPSLFDLYCVVFGMEVSSHAASNCPFCNAISGTISDEIGESKVAVIARCSSTVPAKSAKELHLSSFRIESTMKGGEHVKEKLDWIVPTLDPVAVGDTYLLFAFNCEPLEFGGQ